MFGRTCLRYGSSTTRQNIPHQTFRAFSWTRTQQRQGFFQHVKILFRKPPPPIKGGTACLAAALTPAAFIEISEEEGEDTAEERMLHASRQELAEYVPERLRGSYKIRRTIWKFLDTWIVEPIATGFRLLHLIIIFVPVIVTIPAVYIGQRQKDKDNERTGTLWWYEFLVHSMERAGAAYIKVSRAVLPRHAPETDVITVGTVGCVSNGHFSNPNVLDYVGSAFRRPTTLSARNKADSRKGLRHAL